MKNFKKEDYLIVSLLCEGYFLIPSIALIFGCQFIVHSYYPGFWTETVTAFSSMLIAGIYFNRGKRIDDYLQSALICRTLLIISSAALMVSFLANKDNVNQNNFGTALWIIVIASLIIGLIWQLKKGPSREYLDEKRYSYYRALNKIIYLFGVILLSYETYIHFGSQYVWLPSIFLIIFLFTMFDDTGTGIFDDLKEEIRELLFLIPLLVAIISTLYQFWFSEIVWGIIFWQLFAGALFILLISLAIVFLRRRNKRIARELAKKQAELKEKSQQAELREKKLLEEEQALEEKRKSVMLILDSMKKDSKVSWTDILFLAGYYQQDINSLSSVSKNIFKAPLEEMITISEVKKHIVWPGSLMMALQLLEKFADKSYEDQELRIIATQLADLITFVEAYPEYNGYDNLMQAINDRCPTIVKVINGNK
ncbi:MAG: hypothetical protein NT165_03380 [Candidatus Falkowbacteria bacterium]|nr:hypothetical protein [Candidatus Falkowbacteria bacterium]